MEQIYLDNNSTTPMHEDVIAEMYKHMSETYGNPSSVHNMGQKAKVLMEEAREKIANLLGAKPSEIYFTSGGTEADNLAVKGAAYSGLKKNRNHIITSLIEHHAILESVHFLEKNGFTADYIGCDHDGIVSIEQLKKAIKPETSLVSVMMANNETGVIQPIKEMAAVCKEAGVVFHTDAVQAIGKIPVNVNDLGIDMLSLSGHKVYGPKGIGVLYIRKGTKITPLSHGGAHERRKRAGTENVVSIVGLAKAMEIAIGKIDQEQARMKELSEFFINEVQSKVPDVFLNGSVENRVKSTVNLSFLGVEGEAIILSLDIKGIAVSSGSACTSGSLEASHVLKAMDVDVLLAQGSIRFSMGKDTTKEQLEYTASVLPEIINRLREMSAAYKKPA
ncbi:MAG: cysteine desulfurase NifS [candidate division Zixibacteria bacterium]|nr:cysteine desulfurase NifS [candidate division Zixibacteria bacterium]